MKNLFKASDFAKNDPEVISADKYLHNEHAAKIANEKLNALIESWPVVYDGDAGISCFKDDTWGYVKYDENNHSMISSNFRNSRRKARLAFVEEIVKEPCRHTPINVFLNNQYTGDFKCSKCGVELQATWTEKND